jgi:hypothetical protein
MFLVSKIQEDRIRRQERKRSKKILQEFYLKAHEIQTRSFRDTAIRMLRVGFCEGFEVGRVDPGLSQEGFYTKAMTFANEQVAALMKVQNED